MGRVCRETQVRIDEQRTKLETECKKLQWWNPFSWFCWLAVAVIWVVTWVTRVVCEVQCFWSLL
jgi:hypothetical protein